MTTMRISELAERTGVPASTLRYYETAGLVPADHRTAAGYRVYGEEAVRRLEFIDGAKHLGLPLEEIAELLGVWESGACAQVKSDLRPRISRRLAEAEARAAELAAFAATLRDALRHLDTLPDRDQSCGPDCAFPPGGTATPLRRGPRKQAEVERAAAERWRSAPIACTLSSDDGLRERVARWRELLDGATRVAIPEGLRLTVPTGRVTAIAALAAAEQECCAFLDFRLHLDGPDLYVEVRAPEAGGRLLAEVFGG